MRRPAADPVLRVGLTGGIACGKSHVARCWAAAGIPVIDLDRLAHEAMAPGGASYADVISAFGPEILAPDGSIDRKALGAIVFADAGARQRLNARVHPRVRAEEASRVARLEGVPGALVATEAALLVESGMHLRFDRLVVAWCRPDEQMARLMRRDGIDEAAARSRIAAQMPVSEKRAYAHYEIDTTGSLAGTAAAAEALGSELKAIARLPRPPLSVPLERALGSLVHGPREGPRGLDPRRVLEELVAAGGLELERMALALRPPAGGSWFEAARAAEPPPGPASLVAPVVLWALDRGGSDLPFLAGAAASLARLTHLDRPSVADACAQALLLQATLTGGVEGLFAPGEAWRGLAERFGGAPPSAAFGGIVEVLRRHGADVGGARRSAAAAGADPALAGMISGSLAGASVTDAGEDVARLVRALGI
jgi:dephospho-CoA kinase